MKSCFMDVAKSYLPWVPEVFSRVRRELRFVGRHVQPKTRVARVTF